MNILALITSILAAAPQELALVEALIQIAKGTHVVVPVTPPQTVSLPVVVPTVTTAPETVTAAPVVPEAAAPVIPPNGVKETLK